MKLFKVLGFKKNYTSLQTKNFGEIEKAYTTA